VIGSAVIALALSSQIVLVKPKMVETRRPVVERFIYSIETGRAVVGVDFVKPMGVGGATLLKSLSKCKSKGYDTTFRPREVMVNWHCKGRPGTNLLATILYFEGDKIRRVELAEVGEQVNRR
jgi:hypothetical protein